MARQKNLPSRLIKTIWGDWQTNNTWQRILKYTIGCTLAIIIAVMPQVVAVFGTNTFLIPMTIVFAHPGQRMGLMIESLSLVVLGMFVGVGWAILGLYLSSLIMETNPAAAFSIKSLFLLVCALFHGYVRSHSPRLFVGLFFMLLVFLIVELGKATTVTLAVFTSIAYPVLTGSAVLLVTNLTIFPELSSSFLGSSTINTMASTMDTLERSAHWFVTPGGDSTEAAQHKKHNAVLSRKKRRKRKNWLWRFLDDFPNPLTSISSSFAQNSPVYLTTLASLTDKKMQLRNDLSKCKAAQDEVNYEVSISPLPPKSMKPINHLGMTGLVQNTLALIGSCENKFVMLEANSIEDDDVEIGHELGEMPIPKGNKAKESALPANLAVKLSQQMPNAKRQLDAAIAKKGDHEKRVENVKPTREIGSGSVALLESILSRIHDPVKEFQGSMTEAVALLIACLAYCFDVPVLPSGAYAPKGVPLEEIDMQIDAFTDALAKFDCQSEDELRRAALAGRSSSVDLMPRMETFLISSFVLSFRQTAIHLLGMLRHARDLVERRQRRRDRLGVWFPHIADFRKWLSTGGEADGMVLSHSISRAVRRGDDPTAGPLSKDAGSFISDETPTTQGTDEEAAVPHTESQQMEKETRAEKEKQPQGVEEIPESKKKRWALRARHAAADAIEWSKNSDHLAYAIKLTLAVFLVSWPFFVTSWNKWYTGVKGLWAPMQLILVFEVAIGTSLFVFLVRLSGVIFGCVVGYLSYVIGNGNRPVMVVVQLVGFIPSIYVQLATKYVKAGMISIVSMVVVGLAALNQNGTAYENFYKRLGAFVVGGSVAVLVEVIIYPVRARDRLIESLSTSVRQIIKMQSAVHVGIDGPERPNFRSRALNHRFTRARDKAQAALGAAEAFLPFCLTEPRLKGSFKLLAPIYREIIYVLHQIVDRMDNVVQLRREHGSSILEDLNPQVYAYRRNAAASGMLILFSVNEALSAWSPLPQFIPSARLAQLRLVNRVREVLIQRNSEGNGEDLPRDISEKGDLDEQVAALITQRKFLSWNASTAGQMEIIEYFEELIELVKLLVGVNAFRSGMLERPKYRQYVQRIKNNGTALERVRTERSRSSAPRESQSSAMPQDARDETQHLQATTSPPTPPGADRLSTGSLGRTVSMASAVAKFRSRLKATQSNPVPEETENPPEEAVESDSSSGDDEETLPRSLQRMGQRMQQENTELRRRNVGFGRESRSERGGEPS